MKNSILHQIYDKYEKNVKNTNYFFISYIFSFIHQKHFYENQKLNFLTKIYEIRKKC